MPRTALALALVALALSGCAATEAAPPSLARGAAPAEMHLHPPVTTFAF